MSKKNELDQYYTKCDIAKDCCERFINLVSSEHRQLVIEPSAGHGSFIIGYKQLCDDCDIIGFDIDPQEPFIKKKDFLMYT